MKRILLATTIATSMMAFALPVQAATKVIESITITGGDFNMGGDFTANGGVCAIGGFIPWQCFNGGLSLTINRGTTVQNFGPMFNFFNAPVSGSLANSQTGAANARDWTNGFQGSINDVANTITINVGGWYALWSGTYFLQGTDTTETVSAAGTPPVNGYSVAAATGTVNVTNHTFTATWFSFITTAPFAGQTGYWRISGTVVFDETAPVITLNNTTNPLELLLGNPYVEAGATAVDNIDGAVTVIISGTVNPNVAGLYPITYTATDQSSNTSIIIRNVNIVNGNAPVITLNSPGNNPVTINEDTSYTDAGATVTDIEDVTNDPGNLIPDPVVVTVNPVVVTQPGTYTVTYTATDSHGNVTQATRTVNVLDITPPVITQNGELTVSVALNATYTDAGAVVTDNASTNLTATVTGSVNTAIAGTYYITYTAQDTATPPNVATPVVRTVIVGAAAPQKPILNATQNSNTTNIVLTTGGAVTVATDMSSARLLISTLDWSATANAIVPTAGTTSATFSFDPATMTDGLYTIRVTVDAGTGTTTSTSMLLRIISTAPVLSASTDTDGDGVMDDVEGYDDSDNDGIPDYLDDNTLGQTMMEANADTMVTSQGELRLGSMARTAANLASGNFSPVITAGQITANGGRADSGVTASCIGDCFDFEVTGLTQGEIIDVVLPVGADTIMKNAVYRKYTATNGWQDFNTSGNDRIASAGLKNGVCPSASASNTWINGLFQGDRCIRLTIQDGGLNDADGVADGTIIDPGGVAQAKSSFIAYSASGCSMTGNASATDHAEWLLLAGFIGLLGWFSMNRRKA